MVAASAQDNHSAEVGIKILAEKNQPGYRLRVELHNQQAECRASIEVLDPEESISPSDLIKILAQAGVKETVDLERLAQFCTDAAQGIDQNNVLLAEERQPTTGEDGWFELAVKDSSTEVEYQEDERGRIDFRTLHTFTNVEPGQKIGTVHPPQEGEPGITAHGLSIPPKMGKPLDLITGEGVVLKDDGRIAVAEKAGRVVFDSNILSIAEEFAVTGDVDLSVGNIDFNGFVEIKGDVLDDFHITATKGIRITGAVGVCRLESGGPIEIGSMAGMGIGRIRCRGDLRARYLNHVNVECWGNVIVSHEIRNSVVKATGGIIVERGTISGGESVALDGIEAKHLGSISGVKTKLTAGIYFPEADRLIYLRTRLKSVSLQTKRIGEALGPLGRRQDLRKALQEAIELRISILTQRRQGLEEEQEQLSAELAAFQEQEHPSANPKINAGNSLKEGVTITLGETSEEIQQEHSGPLSVIENTNQGGLRFLTRSPLQVMANQMEEKVLEEELAAAEEEEAAD